MSKWHENLFYKGLKSSNIRAISLKLLKDPNSIVDRDTDSLPLRPTAALNNFLCGFNFFSMLSDRMNISFNHAIIHCHHRIKNTFPSSSIVAVRCGGSAMRNQSVFAIVAKKRNVHHLYNINRAFHCFLITYIFLLLVLLIIRLNIYYNPILIAHASRRLISISHAQLLQYIQLNFFNLFIYFSFSCIK